MAIGQGGYKGNLEEIMDALGPQSGGGQFFKDFVDNKQAPAVSGLEGLDARQDLERRWNDYLATQNPSFLERAVVETGLANEKFVDWVGGGVADVGEGVYDYVSQTPEFLSNMWDFWGEAWEPQFQGHVPLLDAPLVSAVTNPVDTALTLGSGFLTGAVSGLEGMARGFSLDESGWPTWSGVDAADAIEHRAANFPSYHPQTIMGRDFEHLVSGAIEGWGEHVGMPAGRFVQSAAELAGADKESAIKWGGVTAGAVSAGPMALPFLKRSTKIADKPMFEGGFSIKELRLSLQDKLVVANDFKFISDAWRRIDPQGWREALADDSFGLKMDQIMEVVSKDLRDTALFIVDESVVRTGDRPVLSAREGIPEVWQEKMRWMDDSWYKNRTWYGRKKGERQYETEWELDEGGVSVDTGIPVPPIRNPIDIGSGGYMKAGTNLHFPTFTRDAKGHMLPNWGRSLPEGSYVRQRYVIADKEAFPTREGFRDTIVHEWEHVLDDILYYRLARQSPAMHPSVAGMPFDFAGEQRFVRDISRPGTPWDPMASDLSPVLIKLSENVTEAGWRKYAEVDGRMTKKAFTNEILWKTRSPAELRARLVPINDYLALTRKEIAWDTKNQRVTRTRPMKVEDLWQEMDLPYDIQKVITMFDDLVAFDVMTRAEATALLKEALAEVKQPYGRKTTELKIGPGPGLLNGGEE